MSKVYVVIENQIDNKPEVSLFKSKKPALLCIAELLKEAVKNLEYEEDDEEYANNVEEIGNIMLQDTSKALAYWNDIFGFDEDYFIEFEEHEVIE